MIWIEFLSDHKQVVARYRREGVTTIGRAYDNDIVLDDPFIAPHHISIERGTDGGLIAVDQGSKNGLFADGARQRQTIVKLDGNKTIRIGRTMLRLREASFEVPPERKLSERANLWVSLFLPALLLLGASALSFWSESIRAIKPAHYVIPLSIMIIALVWALFWTVMSRVFAEKARFAKHLKAAVWMFLTMFVCGTLIEISSYSFSSAFIFKYGSIVLFLIVAIFCYRHLRIMGSSRLWLKAGIVAIVFMILVATKFLSLFGEPQLATIYDFVPHLRPPVLRLAVPQPEKEFWSDVNKLKEILDLARKEEPPSGFLY